MAILKRILSSTVLLILVGMSCIGSSSPATRILVTVVETTPDQQRLLLPQPDLTFERSMPSPQPVITVNEETKYQQMDGFGASLTDSSAWVVWNKLNASQRQGLAGVVQFFRRHRHQFLAAAHGR